VWIDVPLDVQAIQVDPDALVGFTPEATQPNSHSLRDQVRELISLLQAAERPVIVGGNGLHVAGALAEFHEAIEKIQAPVLTTWLAMDLIADAHSLFGGRPGAIAPRGANFTLQNSDLMIVLGSRLDMAFTGYAHDKLARGAKKVLVDIDEAEIRKMKTPVRLAIVADVRDFLRELLVQLGNARLPDYASWRARVTGWKHQYPVVLDEHRRSAERVSVYHFSDVLSAEMSSGDLLVSGSSGTGVELFLLAFSVKAGQRIFHTRGLGAMGFGLPASIGACLAHGRRRTICVDGDGGFQMNIQELATVERLNLPIKFFVINNDGYASIRSSQQSYFKHLVAADESSGLKLPDLQKVATAYGLSAVRLANSATLRDDLRAVLDSPGPVVCEIMAVPDEVRQPRLSSMQKADGSMVSKPLEDLWPFLEREEFRANMIVPPLEE
jgi:acetolactate synthase-1/2/3 large subunit